MRSERVAARVFALVLAAASSPAGAWGPTGHRIVAELAQRHLEAGTRAQLAQLLTRLHARSLADIADRADRMQDDPGLRAQWRATSKLHFVNFADASCRYDARRDCADGACVVAAIDRYAARLSDRQQADDQRADALAMLVHLVADVHQPLHAGYRRDAGGNRYQLHFDGRGTNLHAIWDTPVLRRGHDGWRRRADELARTPLPPATGDARDWAEESCRATRDIYPVHHRIDDDYIGRMRPLAEQRLRKAAARLARLLDAALARSPTVEGPAQRRRPAVSARRSGA